jgi:flagellar protein FlaF
MGFGTIFATLAMVVIIGISSYLFITGALFTMDTLSNSLKKINEVENARLKTEIEIGDISLRTNSDYSIINASLNNIGAMKILNSEFKHVDVFVYYHNDTGTENITICRWVPYNDTSYESSALQYNEWTVVNVTPDLINPGIFDPDEQMNIVVRVYPAINNITQNLLKIVTPNGIFDARYF